LNSKDCRIAERAYVLLLMLTLSLSYYYIEQQRVLGGDIGPFKLWLSGAELFFLYLVNVALLFAFYGIYMLFLPIYSKNKLFVNLNLKRKRFGGFVLLILVSNAAFIYETNVGRVLSGASSLYSPIFAMLSPSFLILVYYLFARERAGVIFWINIACYCFIEIYKGWTGFLLLFFFFEVHFFYKKKKMKALIKYINIVVIVLIMVFAGSLLYKYLFPLKMAIRGASASSSPIEYNVALERMVSRLTFFPVAVGGVQRANEVGGVFNNSPMEMKELLGFLRPVVPSVTFDKTSFNSLNNDVLRAYKPDITTSTSSDLGFFSYVFILAQADIMQCIMFLILTTLMTFLFAIVTSSFLGKKGEILFFFTLMSIYYTVSLEVVFASFLSFLLYLMPLMFLLKIYTVNVCRR